MLQILFLWLLSIGGIFFRSIQSKLPPDVCMHKREKRYQQNPYMANPYLRQALESYEILHAQATAENITEDLLRAATSPSGSIHRYLYLEVTVSGLGNRLNSLLSGFLYALLTHRVLLVSAGTFSFDDIFCQPFAGGNWLWPQELHFQHLMDIAVHRDRFKQIAGNNWEEPEELVTGDLLAQDTQYHVIHYLDGEQYFVPAFFASHLPQQDLLHQWFPGSNVAQLLSHYLFHPRDHVWTEVLNTLRSLSVDDPTAFKLGLQVRNGFDQIMPCLAMAAEIAKGQGLDAEVSNSNNANSSADNSTSSNTTSSDNNNANNITSNQPSSSTTSPFSSSIRVFVASMRDQKQAIQSFVAHLKLNHGKQLPWIVTQRYEVGKENHDRDQAVAALHDILVLSVMDDMVLSPRSTFGYHAMARKGLPGLYPTVSAEDCTSPFHNNENHNNLYHHHHGSNNPLDKGYNFDNNHKTQGGPPPPKCYRSISPEPCFHRSFFLEDHMQRLTSNHTVIRCEDDCGTMEHPNGKDIYDRGWKLLVLAR